MTSPKFKAVAVSNKAFQFVQDEKKKTHIPIYIIIDRAIEALVKERKQK
jgi:hypothetical protein